MKILKPGREQHGWTTEAYCTGEGNGGGGCGALLQVDESDLYRTSSGHYDGATDYFVTFTCPSCRVETDLERVPSTIEHRLPWEGDWPQKEGN